VTLGNSRSGVVPHFPAFKRRVRPSLNVAKPAGVSPLRPGGRTGDSRRRSGRSPRTIVGVAVSRRSNGLSNEPVGIRPTPMHHLDRVARGYPAQRYRTEHADMSWTVRESLITRRSQVQILPPPLGKPRSDAMSDLGFVVQGSDF
jgi:hypothetical protein